MEPAHKKGYFSREFSHSLVVLETIAQDAGWLQTEMCNLALRTRATEAVSDERLRQRMLFVALDLVARTGYTYGWHPSETGSVCSIEHDVKMVVRRARRSALSPEDRERSADFMKSLGFGEEAELIRRADAGPLRRTVRHA